MLAAFRFTNFRSFKGQGELSLVAAPADKTLPSVLIDPAEMTAKKRRLLPVAAIYGANAAGKTNILKAFSFMDLAVEKSQSNWQPGSGVPVEQFRGQSSNESSFEVDIILDSQRYTYGFVATKEAFIGEWLYSYPTGKRRLLFDRTTIEGITKIRTTRHFPGDRSYITTIKKRVRNNSLFLSAAAQENHSLCNSIYEFFFYTMTSSVLPHQVEQRRVNLTCVLMEMEGPWKEMLLSILKTSDPSISDIKIEPLDKSWAEYSKHSDGSFFKAEEQKYKVSFVIGSGKRAFRLPFEEQSQGVKKLFGVFGEILVAMYKRNIVIIDELETSIHPHVARMIVDMFQDPTTNQAGSQLIFTTHDTNLLDQTLLRRDQIWFVEKDQCCSHVYPLLSFSPRKDADLERGYLRGRYGAIPVANIPAGWLNLAGPQELEAVI